MSATGFLRRFKIDSLFVLLQSRFLMLKGLLHLACRMPSVAANQIDCVVAMHYGINGAPPDLVT